MTVAESPSIKNSVPNFCLMHMMPIQAAMQALLQEEKNPFQVVSIL